MSAHLQDTPAVPIRCASRVAGLSAYRPPAPDARIRYRLDANEGPSIPDAGDLPAMDAERVRRYPRAAELEATIARTSGVEASRVIVTNGADDAIDRVCSSMLEPGRTLVTHTPTFEMIGLSARLAGGQVRTVPWMTGEFPEGALADLIDASTGVVALVSPNNPTGRMIPTPSLVRIARSAASVGAVAMIDLAYVEFADEDPTGVLLDEPNAVLVRTFSKAMGLAGCRVGYAIAPVPIAEWMRAVGGPYPVAGASLRLAEWALGRTAPRAAYISRVREERASLTRLLATLGAEPLPSQGNFVLARFRDAAGVREGLADRGIAVRGFSKPDLGAFLRISLPGDEAVYAALETALRSVLPEDES